MNIGICAVDRPRGICAITHRYIGVCAALAIVYIVVLVVAAILAKKEGEEKQPKCNRAQRKMRVQ